MSQAENKDPRTLIIGCGSAKRKRLTIDGNLEYGNNIVRLDINEDHKPDVVWDLNKLPLPFEDNEFQEVHAYDVLEHLGTQGDYVSFFNLFNDIHRIMRKDALFFGLVPHWKSMWAWGDPGHTRIITTGTITFLSQKQYEEQVGKTAMSDYRYIYKGDFDIIEFNEMFENGDKEKPISLAFVLKAEK